MPADNTLWIPPLSPKDQKKINRKRDSQWLARRLGLSDKTPWDLIRDLLSILLVPIVIAMGTLWFSAQQSETSMRIAQDQQQESALQTYLDRMSDLLLNSKLHESKPNSEFRSVARSRTLTILSQLNGIRKGELLRFLLESDLLDKKNVIIYLSGADLSGASLYDTYLSDASFSEVNFRGADFDNANLDGTILAGADLIGASLAGAGLGGACLLNTDLRYADLSGAWLSGDDPRAAFANDAVGVACHPHTDDPGAALHGANLRGADLRGASLAGADLRDADLRGADLSGAVLGAYITPNSYRTFRDATVGAVSLSSANLSYADLRGADLRGASLAGADLRDADLRGADLSGAVLGAYITPNSYRTFRDATVGAVSLSSANLSYADLRGANLKGAVNVTPEQLAKAESLKGATMPDGSVHP